MIRPILYLVVAIVGLFVLRSLPVLADEPKPQPGHGFTILHTNDIHGHLTPWLGWEGDLAGKEIGGLDHLGSAIHQVRDEVGKENVILLDAGDTLGDTMIADETQGKAIIDVMNALDYTAMVIGNHEPDFTAAVLKQRIAGAHFPVLAANITQKKNGRLFTRPYIIQKVQGVKVGILGLAYPNTPLTTGKDNISDLEFQDAPQVARSYIPRMRHEGAQLIVVLSHYGLSADKALAKAVPGIDVIVGGHSHNRMQEALVEGKTLIVQAGAHGSDLGRLDLEVRKGKIVAYAHKLITIDDAQIPSDPQIAGIIEHDSESYQKEMDENIGKAKTPLTRAQTIAGQDARKRDEESAVDSLFADIIRDKTHVDVVILPGVGYGTSIPPGPIHAADLRNLIPHESKTVTLVLNGEQIRDILEQSLEDTYTDDPKKKVGGLVQVSGLRFTYRADADYPHRLVDVRVQGQPLDPQRDYKVATNSLLAGGGHRYRTFLHAKDVEEGEPQYELIKEAFQERGNISTPQLGRIQKIEKPDLSPKP